MEAPICQIEWGMVDSNAYLMMDKGSAVVVDPVGNDQIYKILEGHSIAELAILLTHEHFDHISGLEGLRRRYPCKVYASMECSERIQSAQQNLSAYADVIRFFNRGIKPGSPDIAGFSCGSADVTFGGEFRFDWMGHDFYLKSTPGHSPGSICILLDGKYLFTGDSLLADYDVITRFPGGSRRQYEEAAIPFFRSLPKEIWVCPGHGRMESLGKILGER